jgi:hypothetical protein
MDKLLRRNNKRNSSNIKTDHKKMESILIIKK